MLTRKAGEVLYQGAEVIMLSRKEEEQKLPLSDAGETRLTGLAAELYEELRVLRSEIAREEHIPPYMVFNNATLADMARKQPENTTEFRRISGVGEMKAKYYGAKFLKCIREFLRENQ